MFGYKSASHSLITADGEDDKRSFGSVLYFDYHRNSSLYVNKLWDGISELYCLITSERPIIPLPFKFGGLLHDVRHCHFCK